MQDIGHIVNYLKHRLQPPLFVFDATGSDRTAFLIAIAACLMSCFFLWIAAPREVRQGSPVTQFKWK
jgi:hypothetical protein